MGEIGAVPVLRDPSERVSPRARLLWTVDALVRTAIVVGLVVLTGGFWHWFRLHWWLLALLLLVGAAYVVVMPRWRYAVHRWEVTDTAVYTQTGWWRLERRIAPMSRVQTVDYREGGVARLFGLAGVTVTTASSAGALHVSGLDRDLARRLTADLTARADGVPGDAT